MKIYFIVIAGLNLIDTFATALGIRWKVIAEANPIMNYLWQANPLFFIGVKLLLSFLVLLIMVYLKVKSKNVWKWKFYLGFTILVYSWLMILHTKWIVSLI